jgi:hypothetical protein
MSDLKPFRVVLERRSAHEAVVTLHAETRAEAESQARAAADADLVNWVRVNEETHAEALDD